jgi:hypothetical protein
MNSKNVDTDTIHSIEYVNKTEITNLPCGLVLNEQHLIYASHLLYNSNEKSIYSLYNKSGYTTISVSPLQMLWRIRRGEMLLKEMKELAKINKISGRSKLTTRQDYINAFIRL